MGGIAGENRPLATSRHGLCEAGRGLDSGARMGVGYSGCPGSAPAAQRPGVGVSLLKTVTAEGGSVSYPGPSDGGAQTVNRGHRVERWRRAASPPVWFGMALATRTRDDATGSHAPTVEVREGAKDEASEGGSTRRHIQGPPREQHRERSPDVVPCIGCWLKVRQTLREPLDRLRQELLTVLDYPAPGNDSGRVGPGDGR